MYYYGSLLFILWQFDCLVSSHEYSNFILWRRINNKIRINLINIMDSNILELIFKFKIIFIITNININNVFIIKVMFDKYLSSFNSSNWMWLIFDLNLKCKAMDCKYKALNYEN